MASESNIDSMKVNDLKTFLRQRGKRCTGNKAELVRLAKLFKSDLLVSSHGVSTSMSVQDLFENCDLEWQDVSSLQQKDVPESFNIEEVNKYLTSGTYEYKGETIESGTGKPSVKGRHLYASGKVQLAEFTISGSSLLLRCTTEASMKSTFRYPCIAINSSGEVFSSKCTCECADGKCSHVAAVLYLVEDVSIGREPVITKPSTSKPQKWGQGTKVAKTPKPLHEARYSKARDPAKTISIDPRPEKWRSTSTQELNNFLVEQQTFPHRTLFCDRSLIYEDYELISERKVVLQNLVDIFIGNLMDQATSYEHDSFSSRNGIHLKDTVSQADSQCWFEERKFRVTASIFCNFHKNPSTTCHSILWDKDKDISFLPAIQWGKGNEQNAFKKFQETTGRSVSKCGLFLSKKHPWIGASPDGISDELDFILEIKCPYILRSTTAEDVESLSESQRKNYFCEKVETRMILKKSHKYFWQCQTQMYVTGIELTKFVV